MMAVDVVGTAEHPLAGEDDGERVGGFLAEGDHAAGAGLVEFVAQGGGFLGDGARDELVGAGSVGQLGAGKAVGGGEGLADRGDALAL